MVSTVSSPQVLVRVKTQKKAESQTCPKRSPQLLAAGLSESDTDAHLTIGRITILYYWCRISVLSQCLVPGSSCAAKDQGMIVGLLWICDDITACNIFSVTSYRQQVFFQAHSDFI